MKKLGFIVMPLMAVSLLASCGCSKPRVDHFVTFECYGGEHVPTQRVKDGKTATEPTPKPTRGKDEFLGWFTDFDKPAYTFKEKVTDDITLYAGWKVAPDPETTCSFKFTGEHCSINGYKNEPFEITLPKGTQTQFQIDPEDGYLLPTNDDQHFKLIKGSAEYEPTTGLIKIGNMSGDIEIEAKSELAPPIPVATHTVTFDANGGTLDEGKGAVPKIEGITSGKNFYSIADFDNIQTATKANHTFVGWGLSEHTPDKIKDSYEITNSFTAYAIFNPFATATITLTANSENCKLYYNGSYYGKDIQFNVPANEDIVLTVEPDEGYLPVFNGHLTFTGASGSTGTFDSSKKEITVNLKTNSNNVIYASTTSPSKENLEAYSWSEIKTISENGIAPAVFKVGDEKTVKLSENGTEQNFAHTVRIIGFNHDKDPEGNDLGITFEFENVITDAAGNAKNVTWDYYNPGSGYNNHDYRAARLNTFLNSDILNMFPSGDIEHPDLKEVIKPVDKKVGVSTDEGQSYTATSFDGSEHPYPYLFPLAHDEMATHVGRVTSNEGSQYQYYNEHPEDIVKRKAGVSDDNDDTESYWLRSPDTVFSMSAWCIYRMDPIMPYSFGSMDIGLNSYAVAPAFCI